MSLGKVVVHLVHGTWPYGPLRHRAKSRAKPSWFNEGSPFRQRLQLLNDQVCFETFSWSGRNTFKARWEASREFKKYLQEMFSKYDDSVHIVVAHSHGGTVVTQNLAWLRCESAKLAAVICLATPFAYLSRSWDENHQKDIPLQSIPFCAAIANVFLFLFFSILAFRWGDFLSINGFIPLGVAIVLFGSIVHIVINLSRPAPKEMYYSPPISTDLPIFVLRATRDEASMLLTFVQTLNAIAAKIVNVVDHPLDHKLVMAILTPLIGGVGAYITILVESGIESPMTLMSWFIFFLITVSAIASSVFISAYFATAISVGFWYVRSWPQSVIEVEPVPPNKTVEFHSFTCPPDWSRLRHGLYNMEDTQDQISILIRRYGSSQ